MGKLVAIPLTLSEAEWLHDLLVADKYEDEECKTIVGRLHDVLPAKDAANMASPPPEELHDAFHSLTYAIECPKCGAPAGAKCYRRNMTNTKPHKQRVIEGQKLQRTERRGP